MLLNSYVLPTFQLKDMAWILNPSGLRCPSAANTQPPQIHSSSLQHCHIEIDHVCC